MSYRPDDGLETAGTLFAMLMAAFGLAILAYIFMPTAAGALECQDRPADGKSYWSYRIINGERCWYRGEQRIPKSDLHWPDQPKAKKIKGDPVFQIRAEASGLDAVTWHMTRAFDQAQPIKPPLFYNPSDIPEPECCWPELNEFDRRFTGEP